MEAGRAQIPQLDSRVRLALQVVESIPQADHFVAQADPHTRDDGWRAHAPLTFAAERAGGNQNRWLFLPYGNTPFTIAKRNIYFPIECPE